MADDTPTQPTAANPLAALLPGGMSNPYILLATVLIGSGTVTFGVNKTTAPEPVATKAEVAALSEKVDAAIAVMNRLAGAVEAHHSPSGEADGDP
jgi:hypothetical protein